jgi:hypothetical protein
VSPLDELLASYLDLARHLDPLRHPHEAPLEVQARLGRFDVPWLAAQAIALKAIANGIEDLDEVESLDDEVDRTMLIDTVRADVVRLHERTLGDTADPGAPLDHVCAALDALMGEDFDAAREAALRARIAELPEFLATQREDNRPAPRFLLDVAIRLTTNLVERLDAAAERLDDEAVSPARSALATHLQWLTGVGRVGGEAGIGEEAVEARLRQLSNDPVGVKGTLRMLELRRSGVERSLASAADELGYGDDWRAALDALPEIAELDVLERLDAWEEEWQRVGAAFEEIGLPALDIAPPPPPLAEDRATLAAWAVRARAAAMLEAARALQPRAVRRLLVAPGLRLGWGRTVAALLRESQVLGTPERRLASAELALRDAVAAEAELLLQSRRLDPDALVCHVTTLTGISGGEARDLVAAAAEDPFEAVAAALAHEGWQGWFAEDGGDPAAFLARAMASGGLAVPLARWAATKET